MSGQKNCVHCGAEQPGEGDSCLRCLMETGLEAGEKKPLGPGFLDDLPMTGRELLIAGKYRVVATLGRGGMGVVYKAWQENLERMVALKMVSSGAHAGMEEKLRFLHEAKTVARLRHPGLVAVYDWGEQDGIPYYTMEYVEGRDLAQVVREEGLVAARRAAELVQEVAAVMAYAHGQQVLHRDLKPQNLLLDPAGRVKITDFGLAKRLDVEAPFSSNHQVLGTVGYMAPEQAAGGGQPGRAADIYGLGAVLYHLLSGRAPFVGNALGDVLDQVLHAEPVPVRRLNASVPLDLETICLKCLEKDPQRRYDSAEEVAAELKRFLAGEPIQARPANRGQRLKKWFRREPRVAWTVAGLFLSISVGLCLTLWMWHGSSMARHKTRQANALLVLKVEELQIRQAESAFAGGDTHGGLEILTNVLAANPLQAAAAARLISALSTRRFLRPVCRFSHPKALSFDLDREGAIVATGSADGKVQLWDGLAGRPWGPPITHPRFCHLALNAAGSLLATCGADGSVRIQECATGIELQSMKVDGAVTKAEFSPDGTLLALGENSGKLWVWDLAARRPVIESRRHSQELSALRFDATGTRLLTTSFDATVWVWDLDRGQAVEPSLLHASPVNDGDFSPDGRWVATAFSQAQVWDAQTALAAGGPLPHDSAVTAAAFSPDGGSLLTGTAAGDAAVWNLATRRLLNPASRHGAWIRAVQFGPDGTWFATIGRDHFLKIWDTFSGQPLTQPFAASDTILRVSAVSPGNELLVISADGVATRLGLSGALPPAIPRRIGRWMHRAHASLDGRWAVLCLPDMDAEVWDLGRSSLVAALAHGGHVIDACFDPDARRVLTCGADGRARIWDVPAGQPAAPVIAHPQELVAGRFGPGGRWVALACMDGAIHVHDARSAAHLCELPGSGRFPIFMAFSPDGQSLAVASPPTDLKVWRLPSPGATNRPALQWSASHPVSALAFSPTGEFLAAATTPGPVILRHAAGGAPWGEPLNHPCGVLALGFDPSGRRLVTGDADRRLRIWDVPTGLPISEPLALNQAPKLVQFLPGGDRILAVTGGLRAEDSTAWVWHEPAPRVPPPRQLLELAGQVGTFACPMDLAGIGRPAPGPAAGLAEPFYRQWAAWLDTPLARRAIAWDSPRPAGLVLSNALSLGLVAEGAAAAAATLALPEDAHARSLLAQSLASSPAPNAYGQAAFLSLRATRLAPASSQAWERHAGVLALGGQLKEALAAFDRATALQRDDLPLHLRQLDFLARHDSISNACSRADQLLERFSPLAGAGQPVAGLRLARGKLALRAGDYGRYLRERLAVFGVPPRAAGCPPGAVDLTAFYNASLADDWHNPADEGNNLALLPTGLVKIADIPFDIRGIVQVSGIFLRNVNRAFPEMAPGIPLPSAGRRIHFLVGAGWTDAEGTAIGRFLLHDSENRTHVLDLVYGKNVHTWAFSPDFPPVPSGPAPAWSGTQSRWLKKPGWGVNLYLCTWTNPQPSAVIRRVDFASTMSMAAPFLVAITVE